MNYEYNRKYVSITCVGLCFGGDTNLAGWCCLLKHNNLVKEISGSEENVTDKTHAALIAIVKGLMALRVPCDVELYIDNQYCMQAFTKEWIYSWEKRGWKRGDGQDIAHKELWAEFTKLSLVHKIHIRLTNPKIDKEMRRCVEIATSAVTLGVQIKHHWMTDNNTFNIILLIGGRYWMAEYSRFGKGDERLVLTPGKGVRLSLNPRNPKEFVEVAEKGRLIGIDLYEIFWNIDNMNLFNIEKEYIDYDNEVYYEPSNEEPKETNENKSENESENNEEETDKTE